MAFESLQRVWSDERTLHRDDRWLVVDKPAALPFAGPPPSGGLCERLTQHGLGAVRMVWGPPERASGVSWLALEGETKRSSDVLARPSPIESECIVALDPCHLAPSGRIDLEPSQWGSPHTATGDSSLRYRVLRRQSGRALVEIQTTLEPSRLPELLASHGHPVVGDASRGAPAATRLWLHVQRQESAGISVHAPLPSEFDAWLLGTATRPPSAFEAVLSVASLARGGLWADSGAFRLIAEEAGEIAGLTLDRYGDYALLGLSSDEAWEQRFAFADCVMAHGARAVYAKRQLRADLRRVARSDLAPREPLRGTPAPDRFTVQQQGLAFWVSLADGLSTGLFLDQRANWQRLRSIARGATVLNTFCYTGAFSVAAAVGGSSNVVSVDLSARALERTHANLELNGVSGPQQRLLKDDVLRWLERAVRTGRKFDCIILDPPSFGTRARGVLRADRDYAALAGKALHLLAPGGRLLCVSHQRELSHTDLLRLIRSGLQELGREGTVESWVGDWDCPTVPGVSPTKSVLASLS
jgi:23S rRNA (cytosine1962-C5)-methyltransferase